MNNMKPSQLLAMIAFLLGIAFFTGYKSLELSKKDDELRQSVDNLGLKLAGMQSILNETKQALSESSSRNEELQGEADQLNAKLKKSDNDLMNYKRQLSLLIDQLQRLLEDNAALGQMKGEFIRLQFENREMKRTLSSVQELKKAIREVKIKNRDKKRTRLPNQVKREQLFHLPEGSPQPETNLPQNKGFLTKDGKQAPEEVVNIKVEPTEAGAK